MVNKSDVIIQKLINDTGQCRSQCVCNHCVIHPGMYKFSLKKSETRRECTHKFTKKKRL